MTGRGKGGGAIIMLVLTGFVLITSVGWRPAAVADAVPKWVDELKESFAFYEARYPEGNWRPYAEQIAVIGATVERGDWPSIKQAMEELLMMLRSNRHGINGSAAHALFWIAFGLIPPDPAIAELASVPWSPA